MFPTKHHSFPPSPTSLHPRQFEAELPRPSSTCQEVVVALSTAISIPDYHRFYDQPIREFRPVYRAFPDGSLAAPPLLDDITASYALLLFIGALIMLFLRNTIVSADYIRRGRVKYKALFYVLLVSQLMGFVTFVLSATTYFTDDVNCKFIVITAGVLTEASSALLLTGILGVKAYKCLNDSKRVFAIVSVLQAASSSFILADLFRFQAQRTLVGSCCIVSELRLVLFGIIARLLLAVFISLCFIYALWKSSKIPAAQGRISIGLSVANSETGSTHAAVASSSTPRPRGWWDYVGETGSHSQHVQDRPLASSSSWVLTEDRGFFRNMIVLFRSLWSDSRRFLQRQASTAPSEKSFVPLSATHMSEKSEGTQRPASMTQSTERRMSRLTVSIHHFREVMRNELAHTAFITVTNVVVSVIGLIGFLEFRLPTSSEYIIGANWAILSLLVIHSFGRVVARNERDAQIQHPSAWDPTFKVQEATSSGISGSHLQRAWSSISVASNSRSRRTNYATDLDIQSPRSPDELPNTNEHTENPFDDFERVQPNDANTRVVKAPYSAVTPTQRHHDISEVEDERTRHENPFLSPEESNVSRARLARNAALQAERESVSSEYSALSYGDGVRRQEAR